MIFLLEYQSSTGVVNLKTRFFDILISGIYFSSFALEKMWNGGQVELGCSNLTLVLTLAFELDLDSLSTMSTRHKRRKINTSLIEARNVSKLNYDRMVPV